MAVRISLLATLSAALLPCTAVAQDDAAAVASANRQYLALVERGPDQGWQATPGGVHWRRVKGDGSGTRPAVDGMVTAHYEGKLVDGTIFDSSYARGEPIIFPVSKVIPGWQQLLPLMGVGDTVEAAIPFQLAYGPKGKGPIPPGATLLFKIELLSTGQDSDAGDKK